MVSAVFHSPLDAAPVAAQNAMNNVAISASPASARSQKQSKTEATASPAPASRDWAALSRSFWMAVLPPLCGLGLLIGLWAVVSTTTGGSIPNPVETWKQALEIPFYRNGPNDQGVGWNVLMSLERVAVGFGMAALVGIPAGFVIGRFSFLSRMFNPLISLLRPVSPLAWLPIGLLVFKGANPAAIWTIFICSIWPMIINTAVGVQRVPQDYMNVA
ncbi:MAG: nitrate ABC transporter, permease protein, partial [Acidovorax sp. SCN 65-108]